MAQEPDGDAVQRLRRARPFRGLVRLRIVAEINRGQVPLRRLSSHACRKRLDRADGLAALLAPEPVLNDP